jgi:aspartyl-tRNA(Asn)/glutamyl-tRNA(Gln) amidotransferase subunit A
VKRRIMIGTYALSAGYFDAYYRQAQKVRTLIMKDFTEAFAKVDIIIAPIAPTPAFKVGAHADDPVAMYLEDAFMDGVVMAGIPALSVPAGFSKQNLPIGLQIMGRQWGEEGILRAAHAFEQQTKWYARKPAI